MLQTALMPMAGLVLCGGRSSRMGIDKALLRVHGRALVDLLAARLAEVCDPVILAPGRPGRLGSRGLGEVADSQPRRGPLGGLVAGLEASPHPLLAVVAVDMPMAHPGLLRYLADRLEDHDAIVPEGPSGPEPLHAVYHVRARRRLRRALTGGHLGVVAALDRLDTLVVPRPALERAGFGPSFAANLNEPDDLWMAEAVME